MNPENSIQELAAPWWEKDSNKDYRRGRLIRAYLPHVDQIPRCLNINGRSESTVHNKIEYSISPLRVNSPPKKPALPSAALPALYGKEVYTVHKAKKRPAIIISEGGVDIPNALRAGKPKWQTAPTILVAPCYGGDEGENRSGFNPDFVKKLYDCEFPQFIVDTLPVGGVKESIIRLDHIQPIGKHHDSVEFTEYCLSEEALKIIDEWVDWLVTGEMDEDSTLYFYREEKQ